MILMQKRKILHNHHKNLSKNSKRMIVHLKAMHKLTHKNQ